VGTQIADFDSFAALRLRERSGTSLEPAVLMAAGAAERQKEARRNGPSLGLRVETGRAVQALKVLFITG
jgi:hypothetical protein